MGENPAAVEILLVEDSPGDVRLTLEAFRDANKAVHLHVATDGVDAMAFLRREGAHRKARRPALILLDLNLPRMDGREVLAGIKEDAGLRTIPTVILTTSVAEADIAKSYRAPGELLPQQARAARRVRGPREEHQRLLADQGHAATAAPGRMNTKTTIRLLLVEDNPGDARLLREMFNEQGSHRTEVTHVQSMAEAEKYLVGP